MATAWRYAPTARCGRGALTAHGQLGIGSYVNQPFPMRIAGFSSRAVAIAAGDNHTIIIEEGTGQVWLCGWNVSGCLGIGETTTLDVMHPDKASSERCVHRNKHRGRWRRICE